jgi:YVTN family beta-propeller protein
MARYARLECRLVFAVIIGMVMAGWIWSGPPGVASSLTTAPSTHVSGEGLPGAAPASLSYSILHTITVGSYPSGVFYDSATGTVYTANRDSENISVVNASTFRVVGTIVTGTPVHMFVMDTVSGRLIVSSDSTPNVTVVNPTTNTIAGMINLTGYSSGQGLGFDPTTGELFVVASADFDLLTLNATTYAVTRVTALTPYPGGGAGFAIDSSSHVIYFPDRGTISAQLIGERNGTSFASITLPGLYGPTASYYDPGNGLVYFMLGGLIASPGNQTLVLNPSTNSEVTSITVGAWPMWSGYDPVRHLLYISGGAGNDVSVVNDTTNTVVANIPLPAGGSPGGIAVDSSTGTIFVADTGLDELLEIGITPPSYSVVFTESGLPPSTPWVVSMGGITKSTTNTTITFTEPNGVYNYTLIGVGRWWPSPGTGELAVNGSGRDVPVFFTLAVDLVFVVKGLPAGTIWWVNVTNATTDKPLGFLLSTSSTQDITVGANGSYSYSVAFPRDWSGYDTQGTVNVGTADQVVIVSISGSSPSSASIDWDWLGAGVVIAGLAVAVAYLSIRGLRPPGRVPPAAPPRSP